MRIFLKGVNGGDQQHIGLFVGMMKGEYDTVLEWPFCGRISLTIKDQSTDVHGFRNDISGTFMANRNLGAFQKLTCCRRERIHHPVWLRRVCARRHGLYPTVL